MGQQVCVIADDGLEHDSFPPLVSLPHTHSSCIRSSFFRIKRTHEDFSIFLFLLILVFSFSFFFFFLVVFFSLAQVSSVGINTRGMHTLCEMVMGPCHLISSDYFYTRSRARSWISIYWAWLQNSTVITCMGEGGRDNLQWDSTVIVAVCRAGWIKKDKIGGRKWRLQNVFSNPFLLLLFLLLFAKSFFQSPVFGPCRPNLLKISFDPRLSSNKDGFLVFWLLAAAWIFVLFRIWIFKIYIERRD